MLFGSLLLLATGVAAAWTIPSNQPNGVYSVSTDPAGISTHTLLHAINGSTTNTKPTLTPRSAKFHPKRQGNVGSNSIYCLTYALPNSDNGNAAAELENQCGNGAFVGGRRDFYSIVGGSVVYYCNFSYDTNQCFASEAADAFSRITSECGLNIAGYDTIGARSDSYGYDQPTAKFCGQGK